MKNRFIFAFGMALAIGLLSLSCAAVADLAPARADYKSGHVSAATIKHLENAMANNRRNAVESQFLLARIYANDQKFVNLNKSYACYQQVLAAYDSRFLRNQVNDLRRTYGVTQDRIRRETQAVVNAINNRDYEMAVKTNTIKAYADYIDNHPTIRENLKDKARERAFELVRTSGSIASCREFVTRFPNYRYSSVIDIANGIATNRGEIGCAELLIYFPAEGVRHPEVKKYFQDAEKFNTFVRLRLNNLPDGAKKIVAGAFLEEQTRLCTASREKADEFCSNSPYAIGFSKKQEEDLMNLLKRIHTPYTELFFYTEVGKGYILDGSKGMYYGDIANRQREGSGVERYGDKIIYSGHFHNNKYHGYGCEFRDGREEGGSWNNGVREGFFSEIYGIHSETGYYEKGHRVGKWTYKCGVKSAFGGSNFDVTEWVYDENGKKISEKTISTGYTDYLRSSAEYARMRERENREALERQLAEAALENAKQDYKSKEAGWNEYIESNIFEITFADGKSGWIIYSSASETWLYKTSGDRFYGSVFWDGCNCKTEKDAISHLYDSLH